MSLEVSRKQLELSRVRLAKQELEFKLEQNMEEINRLREHIKIQESKEKDLLEEINNLK
jgi:hypothetical protein